MILDDRMTDKTTFYPDAFAPKLEMSMRALTGGRQYCLSRWRGDVLLKFIILDDGTRIDLIPIARRIP